MERWPQNAEHGNDISDAPLQLWILGLEITKVHSVRKIWLPGNVQGTWDRALSIDDYSSALWWGDVFLSRVWLIKKIDLRCHGHCLRAVARVISYHQT